METQFPAGSRRKPHRRSPAGGGRRGCMPHNAVNPKRRREGKPLSAANLKPRRRAGIPVDLTREILLRLPVKSLLRFRLVSKLWLSITRDHQFIQSHLDLSRNTRLPSIVFLPVYKRRLARIARLDPEKPLSTLVVGPYLTRLQQHTIRANRSCNGLIAITDEDARIQVVNPSTGQSITPPRQTVGSSCISALVSLGYHPVTKVYKLVNFFHSRDHTWIGCEVYSLGTSSWREVARFDSFPSIDRVAVSAKGFMYWRVRLKGFYFGGGFSLLRFDLRDEVFIQTPIFELKQFYNRWKHYQVSSDLVNLQDNICLPVFSRSEVFEIRQMDLWMLNEDDHSWTRKYSLDFALGECYLTDTVTPLLIHMDKVLLHFKTVTAPSNQRAKCHLQYHYLRRCDEEQTKDSTKSHEEAKVFNNNFFPIVHVESLILLPEVEDTDLELGRHRG